LILKDNNDVSEKLKKSLETKDTNQFALNGIIWLYVLRDVIIHGSAVKEVDLCRTVFNILKPLIKLIITNEMGS
jgi:hypothetical protein